MIQHPDIFLHITGLFAYGLYLILTKSVSTGTVGTLCSFEKLASMMAEVI